MVDVVYAVVISLGVVDVDLVVSMTVMGFATVGVGCGSS